MQDILSNLNSEQKKIVGTTNRIVIVNAGPGTGKTKTLTARTTYLLKEKQVPANEILALTFTKKAAEEMKQRLQIAVRTKQYPSISTFHSFCYDLLLAFGEDVVLVSDDQRREILTTIKKQEADTTRSIRDYEMGISRYKNSLVAPKDPLVQKMLNLYNSILKEHGLHDYDDLLHNVYQILKVDKNPDLGYQHILIDEFQDTSNLQYEIIKLLVGSKQNLFIIGDPLQAIYTFRGSKATIFDDVKQDFLKYKEYTLTKNYRSQKAIVATSNRLFAPLSNLIPDQKGSGHVQLIKTYDAYTEADWITAKITQKMGGTDLLTSQDDGAKGARFSDFAIIYRTHHLGSIIARRVSNSGMPYQVVGGEGLYESKHILLILAVLQYLYDPTEENLRKLTENQSAKKDKVLRTKLAVLQNNTEKSVSKLVQTIIDVWFANTKEDMQMNFSQFIGDLIQFDSQKNSLGRFLDYYQYLKNHEFYDPAVDKITLLTMHAAKGLEFRYVFLCGFEDGVIPHTRPDTTIEEIGEEKRLLYVAITRAKEELYLLTCQNRDKKPAAISQFYNILKSTDIIEIGDEAIKKILTKKEIYKKKHAQTSLF